MKVSSPVKSGKDYLTYLKDLKRLCIRFYGLGFIFATPKVRSVLLESMEEFINDICKSL